MLEKIPSRNQEIIWSPAHNPFVVVALVVIGSCLLTAVRFVQDPLINNDAALYAMVAQEYLRGGENVRELFDLTFYPAIIAVFSKLLGVDVILAGRLLNIALAGLLAHAFLRFYRVMFNDTRWLWLAGVLILCHEPLIGFRSDFIREFGMWPFCFYAFSEIRIYQLRPNWRSACLWPIYLCVAAAFRYEAVIFFLLAVLPMIETGAAWSQRMRNAARFNVLTLGGALPLTFMLASSESNYLSHFMVRIVNNLNEMVKNWDEGRDLMRQYVLNHPANRDTIGVSLFFSLTALLPVKVLGAWSAYYWLPVAAAYKQLSWDRGARRLFSIILIGILAYLALFLHARWFLNTRYAMLGALVLLLLTTAVLGAWMERWKPSRYIVGFLMIASLADGLISTSPGKLHMAEAIQWVRENLPPESRIAGNNAPLLVQSLRTYDIRTHKALFARKYRDVERRLLRTEIIDIWRQKDYLLVKIDKEDRGYDRMLLSTGLLEPVHGFSNKNGDAVRIYRIISPMRSAR